MATQTSASSNRAQITIPFEEVLDFVKANASLRGYIKGLMLKAPMTEDLKKEINSVLEETAFEFKTIEYAK